jgi:twinkle protein
MSSDSEFVRHVPCPSCPSSNNGSLYSDGHVFCHVCQYYSPGEGEAGRERKKAIPADLIQDVRPTDLPKRSLTEETCRAFKYGVAGGVQVANYLDADGNVVAQKIRAKDKQFSSRGSFDHAMLFGQHLCRDGGKMIVVTEGEIDAMSVTQAQGGKWPAVSIPHGAQSAYKSLTKHVEWLEKFDSIVLMFDMDEPGRVAAKECIGLFTPGKAKVASLPMKDANELLHAGRGSEIVKAIWDAKVVRPDGIIAGVDMWDMLVNQQEAESRLFPYVGLNEKVDGQRKGEVILWTSGSGMGKTEVLGQVYYHLFTTYPDEVLGLLHLEEKPKRTADRLIGLKLRKRVHRKPVRDTVSEEEYKAAYEATVGNGRVFMYDHWGSSDDETLYAKIRYLARGCGCTTIVLDHVSIVVSGMDVESDERRMIDRLMTKLATLAQELNVVIHLISHLKKTDGTSHEEGGRVTLDHLRGSGSLKQLSHTVIALERNQQDEQKKHWTLVRVLKCRETGDTGPACWLKFDPETGWLSEETPPFEAEDACPFNEPAEGSF